MLARHCGLIPLAPVFSSSFSFRSSLAPTPSLLAPPLHPKNSFRWGNPCDASSVSDQNRNGSRGRNPSLAATAREALDSTAGDDEGEGDARSLGKAKGSGTTARGRRLLKVREEKRRREYDRLHNYPTWAKYVTIHFSFSCGTLNIHDKENALASCVLNFGKSADLFGYKYKWFCFVLLKIEIFRCTKVVRHNVWLFSIAHALEMMWYILSIVSILTLKITLLFISVRYCLVGP